MTHWVTLSRVGSVKGSGSGFFSQKQGQDLDPGQNQLEPQRNPAIKYQYNDFKHYSFKYPMSLETII